MYTLLILMLGSLISPFTFAAESHHCLQLQRQQNQLTFFYDKKDYQDTPYFYVKVLMKVQPKKLNLNEIKALKNHLFYLSNANPKQYQIPEKSKKLYIIKSPTPLNAFSYAAQIIPTELKNQDNVIRVATRENRGANNHPKVLPKEKSSPHPKTINHTSIQICEFNL